MVSTGRNAKTGTRAALKRIDRPVLINNPKKGPNWAEAHLRIRRESISREGLILKALNHPRIIKLHDLFETEDAMCVPIAPLPSSLNTEDGC